MKKLSLIIFALFALAASPAEAASRFAVCTVTCTWDASSTAMWSTTTGGVTGASAPGTGDAVIFDGATCVGGVTCTITWNAPNNVQSITSGACTASTTGCIIDNSINNNNITLSAAAGWNNSGTGTRAIKLGSATYTLSSATCSSNLWNWATQTNLTLTAGTSIINFSGTYTGTAVCSFSLGSVAVTYNSMNWTGAGNKTGISLAIGGTGVTFNSMGFTAPGTAYFTAGTTTNIGTLSIAASNTSPFLLTSSGTTIATVNLTTGATLTGGVGVHALTFTTTTPTVTGWDFGQNTNATITAPSGSGGATGILRLGVGQ